MKNGFLKLCSIIMTLIMLFHMLPHQVLAETLSSGKDISTNSISAEPEKGAALDAEIVEEVIENRTEHSKQFKMSNGLQMAVVYASAIHYEKDNQWKEIDNTLIAAVAEDCDVYTNTAGVWNISFPQKLSSSNFIKVTKDGYTLQFGMAGVLSNKGTAVKDNGVSARNTTGILSSYSIQEAQASMAEVQQIDTDALKADAQYEQTVSDKIFSSLKYTNVYNNTHVIYNLDSNELKESVVIEKYDADLCGYRYTLNVGELIPVLSEDNSIWFYDSNRENVVMIMPAPFVIDAANECSTDVEVVLQGSGSNYTLLYMLPKSWLADESRAWPVILDPVIKANVSVKNIHDNTLAEDNAFNYVSPINSAGYHNTKGIRRFLLKYAEIPKLSSADVIVGATVYLYKPYSTGGPDVVEVHKVTENWDTLTVNWSNQPDFDPTVEDFELTGNSTYYYWDVTDIVRGWYEGENTGMLFKVPDAIENGTTKNIEEFYSSDYSDSPTYMPTLAILFRNNNGMESYWDYTPSSAGRAGTGYINNYTGNLVWVRGDLGFGGNRMPVSISHIYNANDSLNNTFGLGYGWRTNYNQRVYVWSENSSYYIWEDSDGTKHYFLKESTGIYKDEDGLELTLTTTGSGTTKYCIRDKHGNASYFDTYGRLRKQENNQATKSSITVTYTTTSGYLIDTITDGAGRVYDFSYSSSLLSRIAYKGTGSTELTYVTYGYSSSNLTTITDKDGKSSAYTYTTNHLLSTAADIDGYKLAYTYNVIATGKPSRVASVTESDDGVQGGELSISYEHNQTTFTDHNGNKQISQFNNWGNTVSVQDGQGRAQYAQYASNDPKTAGKGNQLTLSSKLQNTVGNMVSDSSFELSSVWTAVNSSVTRASSTTFAYHGNRSLSMTRVAAGAASGIYQSFTADANSTYTFSAYVKTGNGAAYLELSDGSSTVTGEMLAANSGWTRLEVSYTNSTNSSKTVAARLMTAQAGTTYIDCVQVEKAPTASRYNLIENGDFRSDTAWSASTGRTTADAAAPQLSNNVYSITGSPKAQNRISQTVVVSGNGGDTLVLGGWAKGNAAPLDASDSDSYVREFSLIAVFNYNDGGTSSHKVQFNTDVDNWQYAAAPIVAEKAYSSITVYLAYDYNVNTVYFDGIQLYKEEFGSSYTYDSNGNVISVVDLQKQTTTYEYDANNNLTKMLQNNVAKMTYTYDSYHNVLTATSAEGLKYVFAYDTYGNNTSVSISNGTVAMTASAVYTSDGNRLATTTDASGQTTTYSYNADTNVLEWVQYPNGTGTKTTYSYDTMYRLATASANTGTETLSASYTYTDDLLTKLTTGSTTYNFGYGNFGLRSSIKVGSTTLATYTYTSRNNYLQMLAYGNQDSVQYTYDILGRVTKETYEDGDTVTYAYDNDGALATVTDSATGRTTTYYYDFTDRLMKYVEKVSGYNHSVGYTYDMLNNLTQLVETINGTARTTAYVYDDDNRVTNVTNGLAAKAYTYDGYGRVSSRVTKHNGNAIATDTITYRTVNSKATGQVESLATKAGTFAYTYDANGNIKTVSVGGYTTTYTYDNQNQLTREDNQAAQRTWVWTYDDAGNILSKKEYAYTTGSLGSVLTTVNYGYGNSNWGDLLTSYGGNTISSDAIGNMLSDGTWTYTWEHGRELATMSSGGVTWSFIYDANGMRTSRTNGSTTYSYVYNGGQLSQMTVAGNTLNFTYDASGSPMSVSYNGTDYYYVTNLQGDIVAILNSSGTTVVTYTYDAWGKLLSTSGTMASTLGIHNPLRYRGYVYDTDTELYYLQSRYYDPQVGRFINADAFTSTGQGLLGNNMFSYCQNSPVYYFDPTGNRIVGVGIQGELTIGDVSTGIEIVIYFDSDVCKDADFLIVIYTYSGYSLSASQIDAIMGLIDFAGIAMSLDVSYDRHGEDAYLSYFLDSSMSQVLRSVFVDGGSVTGAVFVIDGYDNFDDPSDYSGRFDSLTVSGSVGSHTGGVFIASSSTCHSVGVKYGRKYSANQPSMFCLMGLDASWSVTYYSSPYLVYKGHL